MAEPVLREGSVELPDGRTLAYNEFGDPAGRPLLHFHGVPSSRIEGSLMAAALANTGARVIYPDRPGIGLSDHQQDRAMLDWAADVEQLATALGIERFGVLGYSGGGPYALACGFAIPARVSAVGVVAGFAPPELPNHLDGVGKTDRQLIPLCRRAPWIAGPALRMARRMAERKPERFADSFEHELSEPDRKAFADPVARELLRATFLEAMRAGPAGVIGDYALYGKPWGFALEKIGTFVQLWHGDSDEIIPLRHSEHIAAAVPNSNLTVLPGLGHLLDEQSWRSITVQLTRAA